MALNLLKLSVLTQGIALDKVSAEPGVPADGDIYILDETHATRPNEVAVRDAGAWAYIVPGEGWLLYNQTAGYYEHFDGATWSEFASSNPLESIIIACSDESTAITVGVAKVTFRMPYAFTLTAIRASVTTAPTGASLVIDVNESGATILSTKLSIDATEKTSMTAATPAVISDASLADDSEITIDFDQVGLIGHR
jgi:hypothetical protein